jgi:hypothetical protein
MNCIFCKSKLDEAPPEHIIPEHMGGKQTIDCVCESCNHGVLAKIDGRIRNNIQLSMSIDSTSRPRYSEIIHKNGTVHRKVTILDGQSNRVKFSRNGPNGEIVSSTIRITIRPEEDILLYKVFAKILLETLAFKFGYREALESKYNNLRDYVLSESEVIPRGLSISLAAISIVGNDINEFVSFNEETKEARFIRYAITGYGKDLVEANIVFAQNEDLTCKALVILLGGRKSGKVILNTTIPEKMIYVS